MLAVMLASAVSMSACAKASSDGSGSKSPAPSPAEKPAQQAAPAPQNVRWTVYINDDQEHTKGSMTYGIAMNLTAKNPAVGTVGGTYTGTATAHTTTSGQVNGATLDADAVANSTQLTFTLKPANQSASAQDAEAGSGGDLAQLTPATGDAVYEGAGTITMAAAGSGAISGAGGSFSNTSSQPIKVTVTGQKAVLKININGIDWTFNGILKSEPM